MPYRFRDARIQSGKNLAEAAEELFVSKTTLSNWESGRRVPSVEAIEKLADLYGVSVDYLLYMKYLNLSIHICCNSYTNVRFM